MSRKIAKFEQPTKEFKKPKTNKYFQNQPGQGVTYEAVVPALFALQLYINRDVTDFDIEFNKVEESKFDDVVVGIKTKDGNLHFAIQLKHAEEDPNDQTTKLHTDNFIKGKPSSDPSEFKGPFVLNMYARTSFCSAVKNCVDSNCSRTNCQDIHCSVSNDNSDCKLLHRSLDGQTRIQSKYHFIVFTNRTFDSSHMEKLEEFTMSKNNSDPGKFYFDTSNSENIYKFQVNSKTSETTNVKLRDYEIFFQNFSLYTSQKNAKDMENTIEEMFKTLFKSNRYNDYITFFRHCHSNRYPDRKINKNIIRIQLINLLLEPQTVSIYDKDLALFEKALNRFEVTIINQSYEDFVKLCVEKYVKKQIGVEDKRLSDIGKKLKIIRKDEPLTDEKIKQKILWFHLNRPLIVDYDSKSSEEKETVTTTINLCRDIDRNSFVIVGHQVDTNDFIDINNFQNLGNLVHRFPELHEKLEPKLKVHLRTGKSLLLKDLIKDNSHLYNFITPVDIIQMLKGKFYMEERRKDSQKEFYVPRELSKVLITKASISPDQDNKFLLSFQDFSSRFTKRFLQNLSSINISKFTSQNKSHHSVIITDRKLTEEEFNIFCNKFQHTNIHYFQVINKNYLQWLTTKGQINHIKKHAVIKKFISEYEIFSCESKINLICGLSGLGKTRILRRLKDICPSYFLTIFVRLPEYKSNFNKQHDATKCLSSFLDVIDKNGFKQELLKMLMDQKKIIFFLDGFDELHNKEAKYAKEYIKRISQLGFRIWITARDICKEDLEKAFNTISITIKPYSTQSEQEKYVEEELKFLDKKRIIPTCKELIANLNTKNKEILELPLHLSIIVDACEKNSIPNVEDFDVPSLYRCFIEGKQQQFCINQKLTANLKVSEPIKRHYTEQYGKASLKTCLTQDLLNKLHIYYNTDYDAFLEKDKDPWGLFSNLDGPTFIHQTYAEYFAALWISNNVRENDVTLLKEFFNHFILKNSTTALQILFEKYTSIQEYVKSGDQNGETPLHLAFSTSSYETISFLEDKGANLKQLGDSLMQELLANDEIEMFKFLVKRGVDVNGFYNGLGLLHVAVILNKGDMISFLIESDINVNQECSSGSEECRSVTDKILGADWKKYIEEGKTALDLAIDYGLVHIVKMLLNKDDKYNKHQKENALQQAKQNQTRENNSNKFFINIGVIFRRIITMLTYQISQVLPTRYYVRPVGRYQYRLPYRYRRRTNNRLQQMPKLSPKKHKK